MADISNLSSQIIKAGVISDIKEAALAEAVQEDSEAALKSNVDENSVTGMLAKTKKLEPREKVRDKKVEKVEKGIFLRKEMDSLADGFCNREGNKEYRLPPSALSRLAVTLGDAITADTPSDEIIRLIRTELTQDQKSPDVSQVDKALDFLLEVIQLKLGSAEGMQATFLEKLYENIATTKIEHYERFKVDIETAHNIIGAANVLTIENRSTAESLDHLRKMINEPQDVHTNFKYYVKDNGYNYAKMRTEFKLLFHYMGGLVKKNLENAHLKQLLEEIKVLQSVLGVYKQSERELRSMYTYLKQTTDLFS